MVANVLFHSLRSLPIAVLVCLALLAAVWWLYPSQVKLLSRPWRWLLPGLRAAALVALVASILKPVAVRAKTEKEQGAVLILVDRSRSMSITDAGRSAAQLVALADGFGKLPAGVRQEWVPLLQTEIEQVSDRFDEVKRAEGELDYAKLSGRSADTAQARVDQAITQFNSAAGVVVARTATISNTPRLTERLAALGKLPERGKPNWSRDVKQRLNAAADAANEFQRQTDNDLYYKNAEVKKICDELAKPSRFALVEQALTQEQGLLDHLSPDAPLFGFGFASNVSPLPLRGEGKPVRRLMMNIDGHQSNLTGSVREALARVNPQPVRGIVLFSDGRQVGGQSEVASGLMASGVPIFAINAAAKEATRDVSIPKMSLPAGAFVGETMTVRVDVQALEMMNTTMDVNLKVGDVAQPAKKMTIGNDQRGSAEFAVKLDKPGVHKVVVSIPPQAKEVTPENNTVERYVKVLSDKMKVTIFATVPGWDFQYVRNALSRTPWVKLEDGVINATDAKLKMTPAQILEQDVFILSDVAVGALNDAQWDALHVLVTERGGSVMLLAGDAHLPAEYTAKVLPANLLPFPVEVKPTWKLWPGETPSFRLVPSPDAEKLDALKLADETEGGPSRSWTQMPAVYRHLPIPELKKNTRALLVESESKAPVLTESRLGLGRVFFLGVNETWRWRYKVGERDQDRFWLQLIRYAAEEPYAVKEGRVALDADKVSVEPGQSVRVRAKVLDESGAPSKKDSYEVQIMSGDKVVGSKQMMESGAPDSGRYEAVIEELPEGEYQLSLANPADAAKPLRVPLHVGISAEAEMANLSPDEQQLRRLAESSGGKYLMLNQVNRLPQLLEDAGSTRSRFAEISLWDSPYLFSFVLACLGAEWALRKRFGLA